MVDPSHPQLVAAGAEAAFVWLALRAYATRWNMATLSRQHVPAAYPVPPSRVARVLSRLASCRLVHLDGDEVGVVELEANSGHTVVSADRSDERRRKEREKKARQRSKDVPGTQGDMSPGQTGDTKGTDRGHEGDRQGTCPRDNPSPRPPLVPPSSPSLSDSPSPFSLSTLPLPPTPDNAGAREITLESQSAKPPRKPRKQPTLTGTEKLIAESVSNKSLSVDGKVFETIVFSSTLAQAARWLERQCETEGCSVESGADRLADGFFANEYAADSGYPWRLFLAQYATYWRGRAGRQGATGRRIASHDEHRAEVERIAGKGAEYAVINRF